MASIATRRGAFYLFALVLAAMTIVSLGQGALNAVERSQDMLYRQSSIVGQGENVYARFLDGCVHKTRPCEWAPEQHSEIPTYPITAYLLMSPITVFEHDQAKIVWLVINLCALVGVVWICWLRLRDSVDPAVFVLFALLFLSCSPARIAIGNGQQSLVVLLLFVAAWAVSERRPYLAGALLCLSWIKFIMTIPLALYFVWRRDWKVLITAVVLQLALFVGAAAYVGEAPWVVLIQQIEIASGFLTPGNMDLPTLLERHGAMGDLSPHWVTLPLLILAGVMTLIPGAASAWIYLAFACFVSLGFVYHLTYDLVLFIFLALYLIQREAAVSRFELITGGFAVLYYWHIFRVLEMAESAIPSLSFAVDLFYWLGLAAFYAFGAVLIVKLVRCWRPVSEWRMKALCFNPGGVPRADG